MLPPLKKCPCAQQINHCPLGMLFLHFYYSKLFSGKILHQEINYTTDAKKCILYGSKQSAWSFFCSTHFQFLVTLKKRLRKVHHGGPVIHSEFFTCSLIQLNPQQNIFHMPVQNKSTIQELTQLPVTAKHSH